MEGRDSAMSMTNEGLAIEIKNLSVQISDLKAVIAQNATDYVKKDIFELRMRELENSITANELAIRKSNWKTHTLTAMFTAALVLLVTYVFNDVIAAR